jgi:hypothetical protein
MTGWTLALTVVIALAAVVTVFFAWRASREGAAR